MITLLKINVLRTLDRNGVWLIKLPCVFIVSCTGKVKVTRSFQISAFSCINVPGIIKIKRGGYILHAVAEPSLKANLLDGVSLAGEQNVSLGQGSSRVAILLHNETGHNISIAPRTIICQLVFGQPSS